MKRHDILPPLSQDADQLSARADERLIMAIVSNQNHKLYSQLPAKRPKIYGLRPRADAYSLPSKDVHCTGM